MLGPKGDPAFVQRIQQYSEMRLRTLLPSAGIKNSAKAQANSLPLDLCLSYFSHAGIGGITWWLTEGQATSPEQIATWLNQLTKVTLEYIFLGENGPLP